MWHDLFLAFMFFLPAGLANATPVLTCKIKALDFMEIPLDFGKSWHGKRILGDHKTVRGLVTGTIVAVIASYALAGFFQTNFGLQEFNPFLFGVLSAVGALGGDSLKSFFKRRTNIKPGESWFPFDQIDYIVGGLLLLSLYMRVPALYYFFVFVLYFLLHLITSYVGFLLKLKSKPI